jgi:hypothetical protein
LKALKEASIQLLTVVRSFESAAADLARKVVQELHLPAAQHTVGRVHPDVAFYYHENLFAHVASHHAETLYVTAENAMKAASSMAKEWTAFYNAILQELPVSSHRWVYHLRTPLRAIVDFLGHRVVVSARLTVDKTTCSYALDDNKVIINRTPGITEAIHKVAAAMNSQPACPMAIHGFEMQQVDGCYYLMESGRLTAPTYTTNDGDIWGGRFRVEYAMAAATPLSFETASTDVAAATSLLQSVNIGLVADCLLRQHSLSPLDRINIGEIMHRYGVNIRYLGLVYQRVRDNQRLQTALLIEMVARVLKRQLRYRWRMLLKAQALSLRTQPRAFIFCHDIKTVGLR